jgi:hypothetical protein
MLQDRGNEPHFHCKKTIIIIVITITIIEEESRKSQEKEESVLSGQLGTVYGSSSVSSAYCQ